MSKSPHLDAQLIDATVDVSETTVAHNLGRTPVWACVLRKTDPASVYKGPTTWDGTNIYIIASQAVIVRLFIL